VSYALRTCRARKILLGSWVPILLFSASVVGTVPSELDAQVTDGPTSSDVASDDFDLGPLAGRPRVSPTRTDTPPKIDGRLDDEVWQTATRITELVQQSPLDGAPATEETDIYIAYDGEKIYFGFHAHYEDPSIMRANRVDRDRASPDDLMTVYFDTYMDQQQGYDFDVNAYGVQGDGIISRTGGGNGAIPFADRTFDALFETAGQIVSDGYTAEMAIPFKSLRYPTPPQGQPHRWGFQIVREVKSKNQENMVWAPMSRDESSFLGQMGVLEGMTDLSTSRNIEILPTFTAIQYGDIDPTRPGFVNQDADPDAGVNLKYGITSNLTADLTVNPDFSQIESDRAQIEVNQRFPLFFRELRPFFLEGSEIFRIQAPVTLVHTRTIVDPDFGAKLSGKVGPVSLGVLAANDRAPGNVEDTSDPLFDQTAYTFIGRALYDVYAESTVGAMITDREFMDAHSRMFDLDGNFRLNPSTVFRFRAVQTLHKESGAEEEGGNMLTARWVRGGRHVDWDLFLYQISPDLDTDVGFVRRTDVRQASTAVGYLFWPETWLINWGPRVSYMRNYTFDDVLQDENLGLSMNFSFARNISFSATFSDRLERFLDTDFELRRFSVRGSVNTSRTYQFGANFSTGDQVRFSDTPFLGQGTNWGINATLRPVSRLQTALNLSSSRLMDRRDNTEVFDVKILRARTDLQFTDRVALRNIVEFNSLSETFDFNVLINYRINAGTVFYVGYDDHYRQADLIFGDRDGDGIDDQLFMTDESRRTNRAVFVKLQYLMRY
jgi:hypothetical protein